MVSVLEGRYQFVRELGSGAMGRVSLAMDQQTHELVAIKRLHEAIAAQGGARLRREFRSLSQIESEHVVKVFDYGEENGIPFLVMEFVRGQDLHEWLEPDAPAQKPGFPEITRVFVGIASALAAVHAQGVIHRDLKPENVRVTQEGEAKLMDFGLAKVLEGSVALTRAGAMVGTALYMAPEQCRGQPLDYRADLYALGAVLYRALTGKPPFGGDNIVTVVMQHLQQAPQAPRELNPNIPEALEALCLSLLAKNPNERPSSALAVRDALLMALHSPGETLETTVVQPVRADALLIAPLIGRDAELHKLEEFASTSRQTGWVALIGDVGTGKTRLVRALAERVQSQGSRLPIGEAIPDDPTPLGTISRFIQSLERSQRGLLDDLSDSARGELSRIAPNLGRAAPLETGLPPEVARLKLYEAFTELLTLVSKRSVAVFENLHWADESTLALLAHALRYPEVRLIATYRLEDLPTGTTLPKGFPKPQQTITLPALSESEMHELLRSLLGDDAELSLEAELLRHASGNPWVLEERLKAMLEAGALERRAGQYQWNRARHKLPERMQDLLQHRLRQLEGQVLEFARAASVLGRNFRFNEARALLEWDDDPALEALEALLRARLIAEIPGSDGEGFRFTHPIYADLLLDGLIALRRRRLHAKAARLLASRAEPLELAEHHLAAEQPAQALELAIQAGQLAQAAFAYPQAERAYRLALESAEKLASTSDDDQRRLELQARTALGEVLGFMGRNHEAMQLWLEVLERAPNLPESASLAARAKVNLVRAQRFSGALEAAQSLLGAPQPTEPLYAEICTELCALYALKGQASLARHYGLKALSFAKGHDNLEGMAKALAQLGNAEPQPLRKLRLLTLGLRVAERIGNNHLLGRSWNDLGVAYYVQQRDQEASDAWQTATGFARTAGDVALLMRLEINSALLLMQTAEFAQAELSLRDALEIAERIGEKATQNSVHYNLAQCRYGQADYVGARTHFAYVQNHGLAASARGWEARMTLELGDGVVTRPPDGGDEGLRRLVEVQLALSFGDYEKAYQLTNQPNDSSDWHWALARILAGWRLGKDFQSALAQLLNLESLLDPALTPDLARQYARFVMLAVTTTWDERVRERLKRQLPSLLNTAIGQLARDLADSLEQPLSAQN